MKTFPIANFVEVFRQISRRRVPRYSLVVLALIARVFHAQAAPDTWVGNTGTNWATPLNWNPPGPASGDSLIFGTTGTAGSALTNSLTNSAFNLLDITLNPGAPSYSLGGNTFNLGDGTGFGYITNNSSNVQTFDNTGGLGLQIGFAQVAVFNMNSAGITITNGLSNRNASTYFVDLNGSGKTLTLGQYDMNPGNSSGVYNKFQSDGNLTINNGVVSSGGTGFHTLEYGGSGTMTINGTSTFDGVIKMSGSGTLILNGSTAYTGPTIIDAGKLVLGSSGSIASSAAVDLDADAIFDSTARSTFTMLGSQRFKFTLDPAGAGSASLLNASGLDITAGAAEFATLGALDDNAYIVANYTSLTGASFASVNNLPAGYSIDYHYLGQNEIAIVTPEPTTGLLILSAAGLLAIRRNRSNPFAKA